jgi:hypothetical protein
MRFKFQNRTPKGGIKRQGKKVFGRPVMAPEEGEVPPEEPQAEEGEVPAEVSQEEASQKDQAAVPLQAACSSGPRP